ncbi:MAG: molybdopterin converting factor subunit 1 [Burkholderiales bacterium]|nr:molybdopterin converting factor subunit 1 [Pseudomonadota bacterium]
MIKILYFARIKEALGLAQESVSLPIGVSDVIGLTGWLRQRGNQWQSELGPGKALRVAVNQALVAMDAKIHDGDEIAYFPPVTGG